MNGYNDDDDHDKPYIYIQGEVCYGFLFRFVEHPLFFPINELNKILQERKKNYHKTRIMMTNDENLFMTCVTVGKT